jgi:hypothetical protein
LKSGGDGWVAPLPVACPAGATLFFGAAMKIPDARVNGPLYSNSQQHERDCVARKSTAAMSRHIALQRSFATFEIDCGTFCNLRTFIVSQPSS